MIKIKESENWKEKIGLKQVEKLNVKFYDPLPIYKSLKKHYTPITCEYLLQNTNDEILQEQFKSIEKKKSIKEQAYEGFIVLPIDTQVLFSEIKRDSIKTSDPMKNYCHLSGSDAYSDIQVHNATYAHMWCGDWDRYKKCENSGFYNGKLDFVQVGDIFTLPDITYENPLFAATGSPYTICTDGTEFEYKSIFMDAENRTIIQSLDNDHAISHFPSLNGMLFSGHVFQGSFSCLYDEVVNV
jgi:hypothetical protein